jgi:hypothetical protein
MKKRGPLIHETKKNRIQTDKEKRGLYVLVLLSRVKALFLDLCLSLAGSSHPDVNSTV